MGERSPAPQMIGRGPKHCDCLRTPDSKPKRQHREHSDGEAATHCDASVDDQRRRAAVAREYLSALRAESRYIRQALEILTAEKPWYGDDTLARELGVDRERVALIRKAAGLKWD